MAKRPITAEDLLSLKFVGDPQISPDGTRVLFTLRHIDAAKNKYVGQIYSVDREGSLIQWTTDEAGAGNGRWSPCGSYISFVSGREGKTPQIYLLPTNGGEAKKLTNLKEGSIGAVKWSPDGKYIAFTYRETHPDFTQEAAKKREEKNASLPPMIIEEPWYRLDGDSYFLDARYKLYIIEAKGGEPKLLHECKAFDHFDFDWSPTSLEIVVTEPVSKQPLYKPDNDQLVRLDLDGNRLIVEGATPGAKSVVRWSPDGKTLAYLGTDSPNDWGAKNIRVFTCPADGGPSTDLSAGTDYCMMVGAIADTKDSYGEGILEWSPDSKALYVTVGWHGEVQIGFIDVSKPGVELLTKGQHYLACGNVSKDGESIACVFGDPVRPVEIALYDLSKNADTPDVLTNFNGPLLNELKLSRPEEFWIESEDGVKVQGWVMMPIDYLPPRRYPAVLEVHGGPHTQYGWVFFHEFQMLAAQGYVVVYSNPRGSKGYGEEHCNIISGDWGNKDWIDIEAVTRWMQHQPYIHPGQIGIMGGSYGGYMTNWAISHSDAYKVAITDRCVSNLVSFAGNCDFAMVPNSYWKGSFFGDIQYLWKSSPIAYFEGVKTPTLIIHSEGDYRCNIEQAEQVYAALQIQGVETRFVRYPRTTSHGMSRSGPPDMRIHRLKEITRWLAKYLKSEEV